MIIFFEFGNLGNQLFQYVGLKQHFPNHKVILIGCEDLAKTIESVDASFLPRSSFPILLKFGVLRRLVHFAAWARLIGKASEISDDSTFFVKKRRGLLWNVYLLYPSFFQNKKAISIVESRIRLRRSLVDEAESWIDIHNKGRRREGLVFVHIRRGDYLTWPSRQAPAVLDLDWYLRAMDRIKEQVENPTFLLLTDDYYYAADIFSGRADVLISNNNSMIDMALMSRCQHGILSASSFSWWGAWFSRDMNLNPSSAIYLAPNYWGGHRSKKWYPAGFKTDWLTYL